jgi:hypothetical protein
MTMRRNDFKAIAAVLNTYRLQAEGDVKRLVRNMAEDMATVCKQSNPTFDRSKFLKACGYYQE